MFKNENSRKPKYWIKFFFFFVFRVVNYWNDLLDVVVGCKSFSNFKMKLNKLMTARGENLNILLLK